MDGQIYGMDKETDALAECQEREEIIERPYKLRVLKDKDLFPMLKILKTALDMADILLGNLERAEKEIYTLWSDISGIPADEMKEMEFGTLPLMILDTFSNVRNSSFFRVLSKFLS